MHEYRRKEIKFESEDHLSHHCYVRMSGEFNTPVPTELSFKLPLINSRIPPVHPEMICSQPQFSTAWPPPPNFAVSNADGSETEQVGWQLEPLQVDPFLPRMHLLMADVITVEMDRNVWVNITTNKNVRLFMQNRIGLSCSRFGHGQVAAIYHPNFGYIQDGDQIFAKLPTGQCVIGDEGEIRLFQPNPIEQEGTWRITQSGVELQADHPIVDFPTHDVTMEAFYYKRRYYGVSEGQKQIEEARIRRGPTGLRIQLNGILIYQSDADGTVQVADGNKRVLTLNPTWGTGSICTQYGCVSISPEGTTEVNLLDQRVLATSDQIEVSVGSQNAKFDAQLWFQPDLN